MDFVFKIQTYVFVITFAYCSAILYVNIKKLGFRRLLKDLLYGFDDVCEGGAGTE